MRWMAYILPRLHYQLKYTEIFTCLEYSTSL